MPCIYGVCLCARCACPTSAMVVSLENSPKCFIMGVFFGEALNSLERANAGKELLNCIAVLVCRPLHSCGMSPLTARELDAFSVEGSHDRHH